MAWPDTPRLDDRKRMQDRPLGSSSSLAPQSGVQNQYQQQAQGYDRAMRLLNRAARKGDANAALGAVKLGEQSFERGYGVSGGIRSHEQEQGAASNFENITNARTAQREAMLNQGAGAQPGQTVQNTRPLSELVSGDESPSNRKDTALSLLSGGGSPRNIQQEEASGFVNTATGDLLERRKAFDQKLRSGGPLESFQDEAASLKIAPQALRDRYAAVSGEIKAAEDEADAPVRQYFASSTPPPAPTQSDNIPAPAGWAENRVVGDSPTNPVAPQAPQGRVARPMDEQRQYNARLLEAAAQEVPKFDARTDAQAQLAEIDAEESAKQHAQSQQEARDADSRVSLLKAGLAIPTAGLSYAVPAALRSAGESNARENARLQKLKQIEDQRKARLAEFRRTSSGG